MYNLQQLFEHDEMKKKVDEIVEDALNAACFSVQTQLDVTDGGLAGIMFSGDDERLAFSDSMIEYVKAELYGLYLKFVESARRVDNIAKVVGYQNWEQPQAGIVYGGGFYIEEVNEPSGKYMLVLGNWLNTITDNLEELEVPLFIWALGEGYNGQPLQALFQNPLELSDEHKAELLAYLEAHPIDSNAKEAWSTTIQTEDGTEYLVERVKGAAKDQFYWFAYLKDDPDIYNSCLIKTEEP